MRNYGRKIGLLIAGSSGDALDLSGFRVVFSVEKTAAEQPNKAKIEIWNLSDTTASMLLTGKMTRIVLQAGYVDNSAVLFDGNIIAAKRIRQGTDVIVSIDAGDGDKSYSFAVVQQSIASGYSSADVAKASVTELQAKGARGASVDAIKAETKFPRGRVMFGAARKFAREVAKTTECQWSIQDGQVVFCKVKSATEGAQAFLLSPSSGLVGAPTVDKDGVKAACCLNPQLHIYDPIQIHSEFVDGTYKILTVKHSGDTHGNAWTTEISGTLLDASTSETTQT